MAYSGFMLLSQEHFAKGFWSLLFGNTLSLLFYFLCIKERPLRFGLFLFCLEFLHTTQRVDILQLSRIKRMALGTYLNRDLLHGRPGRKLVTARAGNFRVVVIDWMYCLLHKSIIVSFP